MRNNFRNPGFKSGPRLDKQIQPGQPAEFTPIAEIQIQFDAVGNVRVGRPENWTDEQVALALNSVQKVVLEQVVQKSSMLINPNKPTIAGAEASTDVTQSN